MTSQQLCRSVCVSHCVGLCTLKWDMLFVQVPSVTAKNPVVMAAESIIWDIDEEIVRRTSAKRAVQHVCVNHNRANML